MIITVDSNILLSIFTKENLYDQAASLLEKYNPHHYIINDAIYLELAVYFFDLERLNQVLKTLEIMLLEDERKSHPTVLKAWTAYLKNRRFHCHNCGKITKPVCSNCGATIKSRQRILTDFMIGGFAGTNSDGILTFDTRYYQSYFPELHIFR